MLGAQEWYGCKERIQGQALPYQYVMVQLPGAKPLAEATLAFGRNVRNGTATHFASLPGCASRDTQAHIQHEQGLARFTGSRENSEGFFEHDPLYQPLGWRNILRFEFRHETVGVSVLVLV